MPDHRILIVDDSEPNLKFLERALNILGFSNVYLAESGIMALDLVEKEKYDIIFLDILMPGVNGIDVLVSLKSNQETQETPVIMVSAISEVDEIHQCIVIGAEDYIIKPVKVDELKDKLFSCLGIEPPPAA